MFGELPTAGTIAVLQTKNDVLAAKDVIATDNDLSPAKTIMMALM
ncbi:hypothetical protein RLEG12_08105 (plasmid) [Rhizobium leguminosarum bv. trifolii CB782]|nr:hypothetical protein RLEG12_08105 [Rhizobium leguminosarum bv. trifolii CB782]